MLYRYSTSTDGKPVRKAKIYTVLEHGIRLRDIDYDAISIIRRLNSCGFRAYIVGGAVRDLLAGKKPKDFDLATNARPNAIRKLFRRSRIIGKRFKLVHVYFKRDKIIEVSTFRSSSSDGSNNNIYGSLGEDAFRRDFTLNALFYCPLKEQVIDYVDGYRDIKNRRIRVLGIPRRSFQEDPVRMIRAVKHAAMLGFTIPFTTSFSIKRYRKKIYSCSRERLTEEMYKILETGYANPILQLAYRLGLVDVLLPSVEPFLKPNKNTIDRSPFFRRLGKLDQRCRENQKLERGEMLAVLFLELIDGHAEWIKESLASIQQVIRENVTPLIPSNKDLKTTARILKQTLKRTQARDILPFYQRRLSMR